MLDNIQLMIAHTDARFSMPIRQSVCLYIHCVHFVRLITDFAVRIDRINVYNSTFCVSFSAGTSRRRAHEYHLSLP